MCVLIVTASNSLSTPTPHSPHTHRLARMTIYIYISMSSLRGVCGLHPAQLPAGEPKEGEGKRTRGMFFPYFFSLLGDSPLPHPNCRNFQIFGFGAAGHAWTLSPSRR